MLSRQLVALSKKQQPRLFIPSCYRSLFLLVFIFPLTYIHAAILQLKRPGGLIVKKLLTTSLLSLALFSCQDDIVLSDTASRPAVPQAATDVLGYDYDLNTDYWYEGSADDAALRPATANKNSNDVLYYISKKHHKVLYEHYKAIHQELKQEKELIDRKIGQLVMMPYRFIKKIITR